MITLYRQDGEILYGIKDFLLDSEEDLQNLDTHWKSGSSALVISSGKRYILNGKKEWVLFGGSSSSNGGDSSCSDLLNQLDQDGDGIIDQSESAAVIEMESF